VIAADVRRKTLLTGTGETISYKTLIIATGARVLDPFVLIFHPFFFVSNSFLHNTCNPLLNKMI
jgi:thioredoxin reductase